MKCGDWVDKVLSPLVFFHACNDNNGIITVIIIVTIYIYDRHMLLDIHHNKYMPSLGDVR